MDGIQMLRLYLLLTKERIKELCEHFEIRMPYTVCAYSRDAIRFLSSFKLRRIDPAVALAFLESKYDTSMLPNFKENNKLILTGEDARIKICCDLTTEEREILTITFFHMSPPTMSRCMLEQSHLGEMLKHKMTGQDSLFSLVPGANSYEIACLILHKVGLIQCD